ncbi:MAG: oxygen-independent coproporphyrinogen III oxidase [Fibrobacter sp.]|jgi:oxygen-independent coproporphyrinogen-3 oxidase|nr:oxygen-independent coproporphyrinogen III oxidase [Fibrobacter sp.]
MIDTLLRYNASAPRYTSYPPANLFRAAEHSDNIQGIWEDSNRDEPQNLSFYFHVPFCPARCLFCGCTSEVCHDTETIARYFKALHLEMERKLPWIEVSRKVTQIHFGGGTPTSVAPHYLQEILETLRSRFSFAPGVEIAIECNPAAFTENDLKHLAALGFNRISYGIQDFSPAVLRTIGRKPSLLPVNELVKLSRELGFSGINLDLVYGLPGQSKETFRESIEKTVAANPDRIALFSYAHIPWIRPEQMQMEAAGIPGPRLKIEMFLMAREYFLKHGYIAVGMDHFVKENDALAEALRSEDLRRNFQGYCTRKTTGQVYSFGASAISQLAGAYLQNVHDSSVYTEKILSGENTEIRCHLLSEEERILGNMIERFMCNFKLSLTEKEFSAVREGFRMLAALESEGLVQRVSEREIHATELGSLVIRYLAMQLDPLMNRAEKPVFSRTI